MKNRRKAELTHHARTRRHEHDKNIAGNHLRTGRRRRTGRNQGDIRCARHRAHREDKGRRRARAPCRDRDGEAAGRGGGDTDGRRRDGIRVEVARRPLRRAVGRGDVPLAEGGGSPRRERAGRLPRPRLGRAEAGRRGADMDAGEGRGDLRPWRQPVDRPEHARLERAAASAERRRRAGRVRQRQGLRRVLGQHLPRGGARQRGRLHLREPGRKRGRLLFRVRRIHRRRDRRLPRAFGRRADVPALGLRLLAVEGALQDAVGNRGRPEEIPRTRYPDGRHRPGLAVLGREPALERDGIHEQRLPRSERDGRVRARHARQAADYHLAVVRPAHEALPRTVGEELPLPVRYVAAVVPGPVAAAQGLSVGRQALRQLFRRGARHLLEAPPPPVRPRHRRMVDGLDRPRPQLQGGRLRVHDLARLHVARGALGLSA